MKKIFAVLLSLFVVCLVFQPAEASWLSKALKKINTISSTTEGSSGYHSWVKVSENQYFATYVDKHSIKTEGTAQRRVLYAIFKSEMTPLGSAWLGNTSRGEVKPDVITTHYYSAKYGVNTRQVWEYRLEYEKAIPSSYYDVHNNLTYSGELLDTKTLYKGDTYIPNSESEHIKYVLFDAVGWNY